MAKITHTNYLEIVDDVFSASRNKGITHLNSQESFFNGKEFIIGGAQLKNFGTCGYLGLEIHSALQEGSIELLKKYGTQLSMGRVFMRPAYIRELEDYMSQIFGGHKVLCYSSTSTAHISVIATIIKPDDLIILDQQVHFSVRFPAKNTKLQGTTVQMVRHSNLDMLEEMIQQEYNQYKRIWYMADGVYSMHGDFPDTERLKELMDKYPKLCLYFDDAHGMGWAGKHGAGYIFDRLGASERIIIVSTLAKGFGCVGGIAVFADEEMYRRTDIFGGPLSYSHPLSPASVGAAIASAKIHLSDEIYKYQDELITLTSHMDKRLAEKNLPNISAPKSPIYYIGCGLNKVTHNLVHRILEEGFYVNSATFPAVANDESGLRFTITRHVTKADIDALADAIEYHLPKAVAEEGELMSRVYKTFNIPYTGKEEEAVKVETGLIVEEYDTILKVDPGTWDAVMKDRGNFSHSGMECMEEIFSGNEEPENNWSFHYLLIKDKNRRLISATFFTGAIYKDDMLAREAVSKKIEEIRENLPYYLCSKTLAMGSMFSEGNHLYFDTNHPGWRNAVSLLFTRAEKIKQQIGAEVMIFRDFEEDNVINNILEDEGYARIRMPNSNIIYNAEWQTGEELLSLIPSKKRRHAVKKYALKNENLFDVLIKNKITNFEAKQYYKLFYNIKERNFAFNFFRYPAKIARILSAYEDWEFIDVRLKHEVDPIAVAWSYMGECHYSPMIVGLNYDYLESHHIYKQIVFQIVKRARQLNKKTVYCGFSADFEKQKYGAMAVPKFAFMKVDDTYNLELIESFSNIRE